MRYKEKWKADESLINLGTPKYIKQILTDLKGEIDGRIIIVGAFNFLLMSKKLIRKCWP